MAKMIYSLPYDIKTEIFSHLPVDSIIQCKCVCKTWQTLIVELLNDPSFVDIHTRRFLSSSPSPSPSPPAAAADHASSYSFLAREKSSNDNNSKDWSIVGSCNGLVCLVRKHYDYLCLNVCICNPVTKEYVNLLPQFDLSRPSDLVIGVGFGYVHSTKEYKCVRVTCDRENMYVSVYTIGSGTWRMEKVDQKDPCHDQLLYCCNKREPAPAPAAGLLFNGALYWVSRYSIHGMNIISFDLEKEEFRIVPSLPQSDIDKIIGVLGGCFCLIRTDCRHGSNDILVMNKEEGEYTWTKFNIEPGAMEKNITPPFVLEAKVFSNYDYMKFASYDARTRCHLDHYLINYNIMNFPIAYWLKMLLPYVSKFKMIPYIRSLVSLKALGENDADVATTKRKRVDIYDPLAMLDSRRKINTD